jgi:hypothetical protein
MIGDTDSLKRNNKGSFCICICNGKEIQKKRFISHDEPLIDRAASDTYLPIHVKDKRMHENEKRFEVV